MILYREALKKLQAVGEAHLLDQWASLPPHHQETLLTEIEQFQPDVFLQQQKTLEQFKSQTQQNLSYAPFEGHSLSGSLSDRALGLKLLQQGKVGCLLVAGGQGSRLSFEGPKGTFPVSLIQHKSLFQLFAERTLAAGKQVERVLTLAIMTSPQNHEETVQFFDDHARFGLNQDQLFFFKQEELPFFNDQGHLMLNASKIAKGPDGNGSALTHFITSGIGRIWQQQGIEYINFILVDNPLADPFDAELIGFHARNHCDITVKCIAKENPDEQVGVLVKTPNGTRIVEYSEMNISDREARNNDGSLQYQCANISLFCFSLSFINTAMKSASLPWHLAYKAIHPNGPKGWKFETFIFDWMAYTQKIKALLYPRAQCFAPLKNISGKDSLADVQQALLHYDREILQTLCGQPVSTSPIELHPQFYYPTEKLVNTWKQKDAFSLNGYLKF